MGRRVAVIERYSSVSSTGQTTVPKPVRDALGVRDGDKIAYRIDESGVTLHRADQAHEDPAIGSFLAFLAKDIQSNPQQLKSFSPALIKRIKSLIDGVEVDADAPIEGDVSL
jgi:antitoxin PrlF